MEKRLSKASDFIIYGFIVEGLVAILNWSKIFIGAGLGFALISLGLSVVCALKSKNEGENRNKYLKKAIYYIILSIILATVCIFRVL